MITILMAAYNGKKYLSGQIESILQQTRTDWNLIIQDDCSTDQTVSIAEQYARQYPEKIRVLLRRTNSGSAQNNFFDLLSQKAEDYVMFSDQDDIWLPDKIRLTKRKMREMEQKYGRKTPLLVHTDLKVADSDGKETAPSFFSLQRLNPKRDSFANLLIQNIVTGCTVMVNRALFEKAAGKGTPEGACMHDWWLALLAAGFGKIGFVNTPTVLYRQHEANTVGAKNAGSLSYNLNRFFHKEDTVQSLERTYQQAVGFKKIYGGSLSTENSKLLDLYCALPQMERKERIRTMRRYDFLKSGGFRRLGQLWLC